MTEEEKQKSEKQVFPNRLKELVEREISGEKTFKEKMSAFATENSIGEDILKRYIYKTANIPDETARRLAQKYNVTVEWLMGSPLNDYDVVEILKAFSSVFRVETKIEQGYRDGKLKGQRVKMLYMDKTFFAFLVAIKELQYEKLTDVSLDDETFARRMEHIFSHYKDYFEVRFRTHSFDRNRAFEIENLEIL